VSGILSLKDFAGHFIQEAFQGEYSPSSSPPELDIENANDDGVFFEFNFAVTPQGDLTANDATDNSFFVYDTNNGNYDDIALGDKNSYAFLTPNPTGSG
jgi:hypothetical protein